MSDCPHCTDKHDSSGFTSGLFLGLIFGGAGGYLLSTDKGRQLLNTLKEGAGDKLQELADNPAISDKLAELEDTMRQARESVSETTQSARERIHQAAEEVARATEPEKKKSKRTFFRRGKALK